MDVNNNNEINKMHGTEDNPVTPPADPAWQSSVPPESAEDSPADETEDDVIIGDHSGFGTFAKSGRKVGARFTFIMLPIMIILGFAGGVFACYAYFFGLQISAEQSAATSAVAEVYEFIQSGYENVDAEPPVRIILADVFVNRKTTEFECIIFVVVESVYTEFYNTSFRVIIPQSGGSLSLFSEFDPEEYDRLANGDDSDRIQAQIMLNHHLEFQRNLEEIRSDETQWVNIEPFTLNAKMNRFSLISLIRG
jgi:hypothetical protein